MDLSARKLMMMHKALDSRDAIDRLHVSRKEGGRGLTSIDNSVDTSIGGLKGYIKKVKKDYCSQ